MNRTISLALILAASTSLLGCNDDRTVARYDASFAAEHLDDVLFDHHGGELVVVGEPGRSTIELQAKLRTHRSSANDERAEQSVVIDLVEPTSGTGQLLVELQSPPDGYYLDVELQVPARLAMAIEDDSGDVVVRGIAHLSLDDGSGDAVVEHISGSVTVVDGSGDLVVEDVGGALDVLDGSGDLSISNVGGKVRVDDGSGDLVVRRCRDDVSVDDGAGDLVVVQAAGHVTIRDGSGDIVVKDAGSVEIPQRGSGDVVVD